MILAMLDGAAIFAAGLLAGRFLPGRRKRSSKPAQPVCGCGHSISFHADRQGACHHGQGGYAWDRCACQGYSGPEPLPEYYAPEIT